MKAALVLCAALLAGCASPSLPVASPEASRASTAIFSTSGSGSGASFVKQATQSPVNVTFEGSPKLTLALRQRLEGIGLKVGQGGSNAFVAKGGYSFVRRLEPKIYLDLGELFEKAAGPPASVEPVQTGPAGQSLLRHVYLSAVAKKLLAQTVFYESLADSLGALTGVKGAFNRALAGDSRGLCLTNCEGWKLYEQELRISVELFWAGGRETIVATAVTKDEKLHPGGLFEDAMTEVLVRLFNVKTGE